MERFITILVEGIKRNSRKIALRKKPTTPPKKKFFFTFFNFFQKKNWFLVMLFKFVCYAIFCPLQVTITKPINGSGMATRLIIVIHEES